MATLGVFEALVKRQGIVRTALECHQCMEEGKNPKFFAMLNHDLNGNHEVECPRCGHIHYRVIEHGVATDHRHNSGYPTIKVESRHVTRDETTGVAAGTAAGFMRDLWLNRPSESS